MQGLLVLGQTNYEDIQKGMCVPFPLECGGAVIPNGIVYQKFISKENKGHYLSVVNYDPEDEGRSEQDWLLSAVLDSSMGGKVTPLDKTIGKRTILDFNLLLEVKEGIVVGYDITGHGGAVPGYAEQRYYSDLEATLMQPN